MSSDGTLLDPAAGALSSVLKLSFSGSFLVARAGQLREAVSARKGLAGLAALVLLDFLLGLAVGAVLLDRFPPRHLVQYLLSCMDLVVANLRALVTWLMGAPAGLKLNSVLSGALGRFFLYHVHLWVTFLHLAAPHLSRALTAVAGVLGWLGFCLQMCVAQDTFNLITFHVHCFYAYARRLFLSQTSGLVSLWRLFRGKKYNLLRKRVDSCSGNNVDRLFVGTVAFTVLLFLYPTTLMYFSVFAVLELAIVAVNLALTFAVRTFSALGPRLPDKTSLL